MIQIHRGDCLAVLKTLDAGSVDAVVTDPPGFLNFMGRTWDSDRGGRTQAVAWLAERLAECLRVARPGSVLLCWAIPRTSHWTGMAIEDAGWVIRDVVTHCFGQGFPKSMNISKSLKERGLSCQCRNDAVQYRHENTQARSDMPAVREGVSATEPTCEGFDEVQVLQSPVLRPVEGDHSADFAAHEEYCRAWQEWVDGRKPSIGERQDDRASQSGVEGRGDVQANSRELRRAEVRPCASGVRADGTGRRVRDGASALDGASDRPSVEPDGGGASRRPRHAKQRSGQPGVVAEQRGSQVDGAWPLCDRCGKPMVPEGLGTALKPAVEFWYVAQKPVEGNFVKNVLKHGTGALNVNACRVQYDARQDDTRRTPVPTKGWCISSPTSGSMDDSALAGRYPPNLLHSHHPDCNGVCVEGCPVRLMGEQSGESKSNIRPPCPDKPKQGLGTWEMHPRKENRPRGLIDSGTAARFFPQFDADPFLYTAKASRAERNRGCEGMEAKATKWQEPGAGNLSRGRNPVTGVRTENVIKPSPNGHPTVKPLTLMRWLCRLACPPGGTILDPFAGSGSTGAAAVDEGFSFIGIEQDAQYAEIGCRRIDAMRLPLFDEAVMRS